MKKVIKMEMKKINIENDNQEVMKKESVSFLRRKRHAPDRFC